MILIAFKFNNIKWMYVLNKNALVCRDLLFNHVLLQALNELLFLKSWNIVQMWTNKIPFINNLHSDNL